MFIMSQTWVMMLLTQLILAVQRTRVIYEPSKWPSSSGVPICPGYRWFSLSTFVTL